ncbi:MAG: response regulator [Ekhidna sp.]
METEVNVLVVDDSESIREVVSAELSDQGFYTEEAINGVDGLDKLKSNKNYQLIITDLNMPEMDGISFLTEVRKLEEYKYIPILILTTESQQAKKNEARAAGATGWIIKPFDQRRLISVVHKVIKS